MTSTNPDDINFLSNRTCNRTCNKTLTVIIIHYICGVNALCLTSPLAVSTCPGVLRLHPTGEGPGVRVPRCPAQDAPSLDRSLLHAMESSQSPQTSQGEY